MSQSDQHNKQSQHPPMPMPVPIQATPGQAGASVRSNPERSTSQRFGHSESAFPLAEAAAASINTAASSGHAEGGNPYAAHVAPAHRPPRAPPTEVPAAPALPPQAVSCASPKPSPGLPQALTKARAACKALSAACADEPVASCTSPLRRFSSAAVPGISLERYAAHLAARMEHGEAGILLGLCLIMRVWRTHRAAPSPDTLHRLLLAATTVAMKAHFDDFYVNKYMARIGGLEAPRELAELEAHLFVTLLGGSATVRQKEIRDILDAGLVTIGRMLHHRDIDAAGARRTVLYLLEEDVRSLRPFYAHTAEGRRNPNHPTADPSLPSFLSHSASPTSAVGPPPLPSFAPGAGLSGDQVTLLQSGDASPDAGRSPYRWALARGASLESVGAATGQVLAPGVRPTSLSASPGVAVSPGHGLQPSSVPTRFAADDTHVPPTALSPRGTSSSPIVGHAAGSAARFARSAGSVPPP